MRGSLPLMSAPRETRAQVVQCVAKESRRTPAARYSSGPARSSARRLTRVLDGVAGALRELIHGVAEDRAQHTVPPDSTRYSRSRLRMVRTETPRALAVCVRLPFRRLSVERISSFSCSI